MENKNRQNFDHKIKEKLDQGDPKVPAHLWTNIVSNLNEHPSESSAIQPASRETRGLRRFAWPVAALLCLAVGLLWWTNRSADEVLYLSTTSDDQEHNPVEKVEAAKLPQQQQEREREREVERTQQAPQTLKSEPISPESSILPVSHRHELSENLKAQAILAVSNNRQLSALSPATISLNGATNTTILSTVSLADQNLPQPEVFGVSHVLNFVVSQVDKRQEKLIRFSTNDEGSLRIAFNFSDLNR